MLPFYCKFTATTKNYTTTYGSIYENSDKTVQKRKDILFAIIIRSWKLE